MPSPADGVAITTAQNAAGDVVDDTPDNGAIVYIPSTGQVLPQNGTLNFLSDPTPSCFTPQQAGF